MNHRILSLMGWSFSSPFAIKQQWSLPEFCWSTWLAALAFCYACVLTSVLEIAFTLRQNKHLFDKRFHFFERLSDTAGGGVLLPAALVAAGCTFYLYTMIFSLFGIFLSVFAQMEPTVYFGRNGFINSNFFDPTLHLTHRLWPMVAGSLLANAPELARGDPWNRFMLPLRKETIRLHLFVLALPFVTMAAWIGLGKSYEPMAVVVLSLLYHLLSRPSPSRRFDIIGP